MGYGSADVERQLNAEVRELRTALREIANAAEAAGPGEMPARWFAERARAALGETAPPEPLIPPPGPARWGSD